MVATKKIAGWGCMYGKMGQTLSWIRDSESRGALLPSVALDTFGASVEDRIIHPGLFAIVASTLALKEGDKK